MTTSIRWPWCPPHQTGLSIFPASFLQLPSQTKGGEASSSDSATRIVNGTEGLVIELRFPEDQLETFGPEAERIFSTLRGQ